jgi:hypothetical protein
MANYNEPDYSYERNIANAMKLMTNFNCKDTNSKKNEEKASGDESADVTCHLFWLTVTVRPECHYEQ